MLFRILWEAREIQALVGMRCLSTVEGSFNTGVGGGALVLNTGDSNTAVGAAAFLLNTSGTQQHSSWH